MKVLVAGSAGQLGRALAETRPIGVTLVAPAEAEFDISNPAAIEAVVSREAPDLLINAAAYTAVDRAETERDRAMLLNATAAGWLAEAAARARAGFVHVSTDFVFDGTAGTPYRPEDPTNPLGAYGETKLAGERAVLSAHRQALLVRTAWVYATRGQNFMHTMLRLMAERDEVRVVSDQIGTPTNAASLARAIWQLTAHGATGIFHWTDAGVASWYDFAVAILEEALAQGLLSSAVPIIPIRTEDYPTPARRPAYSVLDKSATWAITGPARHWRVELREALARVRGTLA
jgi:dTDP-4-dehydrorhamnose reductase